MMEGQSSEDTGARGPGHATGDQVFEVRITGSVPDAVLEQLAPVDVTIRELRTSLRGHFRDQAELHGFLVKLRAYGLDVVEVRRLSTGSTEDPGADEP